MRHDRPTDPIGKVFGLLTIFDWVTPFYMLGRSVSHTIQYGNDEAHIVIAGGDYPKAINVFRDCGIERRGIPVYDWLFDTWTVMIPSAQLADAIWYLSQADVQYKC